MDFMAPAKRHFPLAKNLHTQVVLTRKRRAAGSGQVGKLSAGE